MGKKFNFWWMCIKRAGRDSAAFANDWQWLLGFPVLAAILSVAKRRFGEGAVSLNTDTALGALEAAGAAFIITLVAGFFIRLFSSASTFYYKEKGRADELNNQLHEIGMERSLCYTNIHVFALAGQNAAIDVEFENLSDKMLSYEVKEMSLQINGIDCLLGPPSPGNKCYKCYAHAKKSFRYRFPTTITIPENTFPITIVIGFKAKYDNVPPIKERFTRRLVRYVFYSINPVVSLNVILEAEEG